MPFKMPSTSQRTLLLGSTGSGKTILGAHILSKQPIDRMPYIAFDYKRDGLLNDIPFRKYLDLKDTPKEPGIYIVPCEVDTDNEAVDKMLQRLHRQGRTGIFADEGFMLPHKPPYKALNAIYTQGRSKHIPTITLSQRPSWISRFAYSEADHIVYMRLNDRRDRKTVSEFTPDVPLWDLDIHPPKFHAKWYDVAQNESYMLLPAPKPDDILQAFEDCLRPKRKVYL